MSRTRLGLLLGSFALTAALLGGCAGTNEGCPGGPVEKPDGRLSADESRAAVMNWQTVPTSAGPPTAGLLEWSTSSYLFEEDVAIVDQGVVVPIGANFEIQGCGPALADLMKARFGATFYADPQTGELVGAGCNGCM